MPQGDSKAQICNFCEDQSMDLLVVTSTARGRFKKALSPMGGVSSQLILEAPCPVLVLPTQASRECPLPTRIYPIDCHDILCIHIRTGLHVDIY